MKSLLGQLVEVCDPDHGTATQGGVSGPVLLLANVQASPVVEGASAQRGVTLALHLDIDLLAVGKPYSYVERDVEQRRPAHLPVAQP